MNFSGFKKQYLDPKRMGNYCAQFWDCHYKLMFFLFSLIVLTLGIFFWYQNTYQSEWSSDQKTQYKNSQKKQVEFKEQEFNKVIEESERRKKVYESSLPVVKDIFLPYPGDSDELPK